MKPSPAFAWLILMLCIPISPTNTLLKMKVGDSFLVDDKRGRNSVACAAYRLDMKITTEREGNRFRIYRTE